MALAFAHRVAPSRPDRGDFTGDTYMTVEPLGCITAATRAITGSSKENSWVDQARMGTSRDERELLGACSI